MKSVLKKACLLLAAAMALSACSSGAPTDTSGDGGSTAQTASAQSTGDTPS